MTEFSEKPYFNETVFVFISDHGRNRHKNIPIDREKFHIPFLIYSENPAVKEKTGEISKTCSQFDVLPVLMGILGGEYENASWGKDIISNPEDGFAFMTDGDNIGFLKNDTLMVQTAGMEVRFYDENDIMIKNELNGGALCKRKELLGNILHYSAEYLDKQIHGR
jgi:phosphoglycerol transferase MdoB-like AlkP superfamily enzyme